MADEKDPYATMSRETAEKHFAARAKMLVHRIKALPLAERAKLVGDHLDKATEVREARPNVAASLERDALSLAEHVVVELKKLEANRG